jgi:L-ascorbate metabolism protein UlaG (beta-lactamase superfamily)
MKIKWFGHSCFLLTSNNGVKVLTDPYNEMIGKLPAIEADIVTVSHQHGDHNNVKAVNGPATVVDRPVQFHRDGVEISGIETAHDETGGSKRGKNIVFKISMDGISLCHCGDLGHLLTPEQVSFIGKADVLMLPVGGFFTIDAGTAAKVVGQIKPIISIPMHYNTGNSKLPIKGVEPFVDAMGVSVKKIGGQEIDLSDGELSKFAGIVVFSNE